MVPSLGAVSFIMAVVAPAVPLKLTPAGAKPVTGSLKMAVKLIVPLLVGSDWPAAWLIVTLGGVMSYVTVLSVLVEAVLGLPTRSVAALAGMEAVTGSLGQGLSIAVGMALGLLLAASLVIGLILGPIISNHSTIGTRPRKPVARHSAQPFPPQLWHTRRTSRWFTTKLIADATAERSGHMASRRSNTPRHEPACQGSQCRYFDRVTGKIGWRLNESGQRSPDCISFFRAGRT